jgi:hypothetical protein
LLKNWKVENFQLQNFFPTEKFVSANHILQNLEMGFKPEHRPSFFYSILRVGWLAIPPVNIRATKQKSAQA